MDFFNEVGKFAKTVTGKAGEMVDVTRLNSKIGGLKSEIAALQQQIGEYYFSKYEAGEPCPSQLSGAYGEIKSKLQAVADVESEIAGIRGGGGQGPQAGGAFCPSCGAKVAPDAKFCGGCGGKI
jgi:hypothetical protein